MNADLLGAAFDIGMAVLLLAFRQWLLLPGNRKRDRGEPRISPPDVYRLEIVKRQGALGEVRYPIEEPALDLAFIEDDGFVAKLRAKEIKRRVR